jgi:hypothetical protein
LPSLLRRIWLPRIEMHGLARSNAWRRFSYGTREKENRRSRARPASALCWARQKTWAHLVCVNSALSCVSRQ